MHRQGLDQSKYLIVRKRREDQYAQPAIVLFDGHRGIAARFQVRDGNSLVFGKDGKSRGYWLLLAEQRGNAGKPLRSSQEMFELGYDFLSKPSNLWKSDRAEDKQTVIRLVLADRLTYARNRGFRTPKTSPIFKALEAMKTGNFRMAGHAR